MPTVEAHILPIIAYMLISMLCAYYSGRVHQWYMHSMDRDRSFREGYNHGYHALFPVAARSAPPAADRLPVDQGQ